MENVPSNDPARRIVPARVFGSLHSLATLSIAVYGIHAAATTNQTALHHYRIERVMLLADRFNGALVPNRQVVDQFLASGLAPATLFDRSEARLAGRHDPEEGDRYLEMIRDVKLFAAFFQELGVAMRHEILDERYTWDVFGSLAKRYGQELQPFIAEARRRAKRPTLYQDLDYLVARMRELDEQYAHHELIGVGPAPSLHATR